MNQSAKFNTMVIQQQLHRVLLELCCVEDSEARGYAFEIVALCTIERTEHSKHGAHFWPVVRT